MRTLQHFGRTTALAAILGALLAASLSGCGGSGGGGGGGPTFGALLIYPAAPTQDGYFRSDGTHAPTSVNKIAVGANGVVYVAGYVRFSHGSELPALAAAGRVTNVLLCLSYRGPVDTGTVTAEHGQIYVHHTDFGTVIDGSDYGNTGAFIPDGVIQWGNATPDDFQLDVTDEVLADILDGYTDIYLVPTGVPTDDSYWFIEDVDDPVNLGAPHLVVTYEQ